MVKLLFTKMLRDIRRSMGAYGVSILIIAIGFTGFSVLSITHSWLTHSRDVFYAQSAYPEVFAEIQQAPQSTLRTLAQIPGVARAEGRLVQTVQVLLPNGTRGELRLSSMQTEGLCLPVLSRGVLPTPGRRELVLGDGFFTAHGLALGDTIDLVIGGQRVEYSICGTGISPENIYMIKTMGDLLPDPASYDAAFLEYATMGQLFSMQNRVNSLLFTLENGRTLDDVEQPIRQALEPFGCYRVYDRSGQLSTSMLQTELDQIGRMSTAIPFLFLSISAVILFITLSRMIEQQRSQIGTLMALGISERQIRLHYTGYGAFTGFTGGLLGGIGGNISAGPMAELFRAFFNLPPTQDTLFSLPYLLLGAVIATAFCGGVAWMAVRSSSKLAPSVALRPAPPKSAKISFLERIPGFVRLFTVPGIMAVRSIFRNPRRSLFSLLGIAGAYMITATLVSMYSLMDVFMFQSLEKNQQQDITVYFSRPVAMADALEAVRDSGVQIAEGVVEFPVTLYGPQRSLDCSMQGVPANSALCRLYDLEGNPLSVEPSGVVISRHMANLLGVGPGDTLTVEVTYPEKRQSSITVTAVNSDYIGSTGIVSYREAGRISDYAGSFTSVLLKAPVEVREQILAKLDGAQAFSTVTSRVERLNQFRSMLGSSSAMIFSMAVMGVLVGFAVLYTSSLISYEELKREISTMMMLGLSTGQCLEVVSTGQWLLTLAGILLGVPMTAWASSALSSAIASEMFSIPNFVDFGSLLLATVLTLAAVWISSQAIHRKLKKLTPAELLRERE